MAVYRYVDKNYNRTFDVHSDGRKFGFFKDLRYNYAIVESADETTTTMIFPGDVDYDTMLAVDTTGDIASTVYMSDAQIGLWDLAAWFELALWNAVSSMDQVAVTNSADTTFRQNAISYFLQSRGIAEATATQIAGDYVTSAIKPSFRNLGLTDAPLLFKQAFGGRV